jgi:hypothetical protein
MSAPPAADPRLLHDLDAALLEAFGVRFDLWVKDPDWARAALDRPGSEGPLATDLTVAEAVEFLRRVESSGFRPQVREQSEGRYLLAIALEQLIDRPLVATTTLAAEPAELLSSMADLFAGQAIQRRRWEEARASLEAYAEQATGDFEEITFLRSLAEHLDATQAPEHFQQVAESVLTDLVEVIKAEALVWLPCPVKGGSRTPARCAGPTIWAGKRVVDDPTTVALVDSLGPEAIEQPAVRNYLKHQPGGEAWPGVRDLILVRVAKDDFAFGWLLALNRRREEIVFSSRYQLALSPQEVRDWRLSDLEFGTVEAGLMASTAAMMATHLRHVELLR